MIFRSFLGGRGELGEEFSGDTSGDQSSLTEYKGRTLQAGLPL